MIDIAVRDVHHTDQTRGVYLPKKDIFAPPLFQK